MCSQTRSHPRAWCAWAVGTRSFRGYIVAAFVTRALYYFPNMGTSTVAPPVAIVNGFGQFIIDITESRSGEIYFATASSRGSTIHRLHTPPRGDCNGDGLTNARDLVPTLREIEDGDAHSTYTAQDGDFAGSWGCDANADGLINRADFDTLVEIIGSRRRSTRS